MTRTDPPVVTAGPDKITAAIDHDRTDRTTLERAEATIRRGLLDAARGLGDIRDGRLYKAAGFTSFDTYTRDRLGMSRDRADQIIAAGSVVAELPTIVGSQVKEGHVRALRAVADDADIVQDILTEVMEENGGKITAKAITAKIAQRRADDDRRAMLVALLGPGAGSLAVAGLLSDAHVQQLQRLAEILDGAIDEPFDIKVDAAESWMTDDTLAATFTLMTRPWDGFFYAGHLKTDTPHRDALLAAFRAWWWPDCERTEAVPSFHRVALHFAACCVICPWSLDELTFMIDWYEDLLASALLVVGLRHDDGEPVLVSTESRDWYGYRADLRHAGFGHLADDRDGAYLRWVQTRNGTRILRENLEIEERGGSLDDVDMTYSAPSAVVADLFREVTR